MLIFNVKIFEMKILNCTEVHVQFSIYSSHLALVAVMLKKIQSSSKILTLIFWKSQINP